MMDFREMKTVHLLLQPTEDGWIVMHKKYKTFYGSIACAQTGDTVRLTTAFGENEAQRDEAEAARQRQGKKPPKAQDQILFHPARLLRKTFLWIETENPSIS